MNLIFIGTAGSGKTSLTGAFGKWLKRAMKADVVYVNLDPGCLTVPYKADFDIRDHFTVDRLMREEDLGPNGAMIRAAELMEEGARWIVDKISDIRAEIRLIDTPGQMEIFVFRPAGPKIVNAMKAKDTTIAVYVIDPMLATTATGLTVAISLSLATQLRLGVPTIPVLSKADVVVSSDVDKMLTDMNYLRSKVEKEKGAMVDLASYYIDIIRGMSRAVRLVKVSARTGEGMNAFYDLVHEALCACGDLT
jgi:GTPase SAR1 family protein